MTYDIIVIGAGLAGLTFAKALEHTGLSILLCEKSSSPEMPGPHPFDARAIALSLNSQESLISMGLWEALAPEASEIQHVHVSSQGQYGRCLVHAEREHLRSLGVVIPITALSQTLTRSLNKTHFMWNTRLIDLSQDAHGVECTLQTETPAQTQTQTQALAQNQPDIHLHTHTLRAKLLIGADGINSTVRHLLKIPVKQYDYQRTAWVFQAKTGAPHQSTAYERFTSEGPLAILPRKSPQHVSVVWVRASHHTPLNTLSPDAWSAHLQDTFGYRLGRLTPWDTPMGYPLILQEATQQVAGHILLLGSAAHHVHPVAGQGFNLTLRDVQILAQLLQDSHAHDARDPHARDPHMLENIPRVLDTYLTLRKEDHQRTLDYTDKGVKLFESPNLALQCLRSLGLAALARAPRLLSKLNHQLMGNCTPQVGGYAQHP